MENVVNTIMFQYWDKFKPIREFLESNGFYYHSRDSYTDGNGIVVSIIENVIDLPQQELDGVPTDADKFYYRGRINYSHAIYDVNELNIIHFHPNHIDDMIFKLLMIKGKLEPKFKVSKPMGGKLKGAIAVKLLDDSMIVNDFLNSFGWEDKEELKEEEHEESSSEDNAINSFGDNEDNGFGGPDELSELDRLSQE